jgi:hypothetical protein
MLLHDLQGVMDELRSLREARDALDDQIQRMQWGLGPCPSPSTPQLETPTASPQEAVVDAISMRCHCIVTRLALLQPAWLLHD